MIWLLRSSSVHRPNTYTNTSASCVLTTSTNSFGLSNIVHSILVLHKLTAIREYWLVIGGDESKLKAVPEDGKEPELSDYYSLSETKKQYELAFMVCGLALTSWAAFRFLLDLKSPFFVLCIIAWAYLVKTLSNILDCYVGGAVCCPAR